MATTYGNRKNLPERLSNYANKENIVYWSSPIDDEPACCAMFCEAANIMAYVPCFWPHLILFSPCLCGYACTNKSKELGTDAILTTTSLDLVERNGAVKSLPLESINSVFPTTKTQTPMAASCCMPDVNRIVIDDGKFRYTRHGHRQPLLTILWCHDNVDEFCSLILQTKEKRAKIARQILMEHMGVQQQPMMSGGYQIQQQPIIQQPVMIHPQQYQVGGSNQQQSQPPLPSSSITYGQLIAQPYSYYPSFSSSAPVYPEPSYPKRYG